MTPPLLLSLRNQTAFDLVNKRGKEYRSRHALFVTAKSDQRLRNFTENAFFLGMKVSRKLSKKATVRNKVKTRIRHLCRLFLRSRRVNLRDVMAIIIPRRELATADFAQLQQEFARILRLVNKPKPLNPALVEQVSAGTACTSPD